MLKVGRFAFKYVLKRLYEARSWYGTVWSNVERDKAFFDLSFGRFVAKPEILQRGCYEYCCDFLQPKET